MVKPAAELGGETEQKPSLAQDNQTLIDPGNLDKLLKNYSTIFQPLPQGPAALPRGNWAYYTSAVRCSSSLSLSLQDESS